MWKSFNQYKRKQEETLVPVSRMLSHNEMLGEVQGLCGAKTCIQWSRWPVSQGGWTTPQLTFLVASGRINIT